MSKKPKAAKALHKFGEHGGKKICGSFEFTGVLVEPLRKGENPAKKLPALLKALGANDDHEALLIIAPLCHFLPGFKSERPHHARAGRPNLLSALQQAKGWPPTTIPDWLVADIEGRVLEKMKKIVSASSRAGRRVTALQAARRVLSQIRLDGEWNHYNLVGGSTAKLNEFSRRLANTFKHRKRSEQHHAKARQAFRCHLEKEVRSELAPHWPYIEAETMKRIEQESIQRAAAGEKPENILDGLLPRSIEIAKNIVDDLFGGKIH